MNEKTRRIIMAVMLVGAGRAAAWDADENQIWLEGSLGGTIASNLVLTLAEQVRYKDEGDFFCYRHTDISLTYAASKRWEGGVGFRHTSAANAAEVWSNAEMVHLNLINKTPLRWVLLKSRLRIAATDTCDNGLLTDIRPEFTLSSARGFSDWNIRPFLADELMYSLDDGFLFRNRLSTGLLACPLKRWTVKGFIMQETSRRTGEDTFRENFNYGLCAAFKI